MTSLLPGVSDWQPVLVAAVFCLFVYPFAGYPIILAFAARLFPWKTGARESDKSLPSVAMIVCALNEENVIRQKIENCLALDYPRDRLSIVVVSDGSTDRTAQLVSGFVPRIEFVDRAERRGKVANLNDVIASRSEEIIVQSDANVFYDPRAVIRLIRRLDDPGVGCATGKVVLRDTHEQIQASEEQYYALEWRMQEQESVVHSVVGVDGAMYAFRREFYQPCPNDTLIEDYVMATSFVRQGKRVVMEPRALAWETGVTSVREEYRRKVRIAAGAVQCLLRGNGWPVGAPLRYWFLFLSHKFFRWLSPVTGLASIVLALCFHTYLFSQLLLAGAGALALLAALRWITGWPFVLLDAPFYFLFGQVATLVGLLKGIAGTQSVLWVKARR